MRKLTLDPEMLRVESFAPDTIGTVRGHSYITIDYRPCGSDGKTVQCERTDYGWESCAGASCLEKCVETYGIPTCEG
jgi:hypothetical protein